MMNTDRMLERQQAVNLLAWQCALRINGLINIAAIGSVRRSLDTYLLFLQQGTKSMQNTQLTGSPVNWIVVSVDNFGEYVEKSWQDFRNQVQILLLTQDEALIWMNRIEKALAES
ncbi:MAG TPA: hypothetical protein PLD30_11425 [Candidatus Competibacteraceae bacterium]|nr:hypothetical protein [Candidatus Competibacteraceae bacterium]